MARDENSFVVVGLGEFGTFVFDALLRHGYEVLAIDRSEERVQAVKDRATLAVRANVLDPEVLEELLPKTLGCAVVGLGEEEHVATLVTHHLAELGVPRIVVEATDPRHAEILRIIGATHVVNPEQEAAERVVGLLSGPRMVDYFAVTDGFGLMEIPIPDAWKDKTPSELDLRPDHLHVVATRPSTPKRENAAEWELVASTESLPNDVVVLVAGTRDALDRLAR